jgi:hypothetical protein
MGVCSYNGGTIPAKTREFCVNNKGTWSEGKPEEQGFQGNWLIGKDFGTAVMNTLNPDSPETEEDLKDYLTRRVEDDPHSLAIDVGLNLAGGGVGGKLLNKLGLGKLLKAAFTKKKTVTTTKKPEIDPVTKRVKKGSTYGTTTKEVTRPRFIPGMALGFGAAAADQAGYSTPFNQPFSAQGKTNAQQRDLTNLENAIAGIDKKNAAASASKEIEAAKVAAQAKIDNMSFFDRFKLGLKDPAFMSQLGAGLQDIGSNIPGQNTLGELQGDYASAAASGGPSAAMFNATKLSDATLLKMFTDDKPFFSIGDSLEKRKKAATKDLGLYKAIASTLLSSGQRADHILIMKYLEEYKAKLRKEGKG